MSKEQETVSSSVYSIYEKLMKQKAEKKEEKKKRKLEEKLEKAEHKKSKEEKETEYRNSLDKWEESLYNLTGDDLEYNDKPKKKKKYTKWIGEEDGTANIIKKPKKKKKISHKKAFQKDIEVAQAFLSEQNKLNADLEKRFKLIAGPADKNMMPLNKSTVDLLSVLMSGRANSLGIIREIGNLKKISADLDIKQQQIDLKKFGDSSDSEENLGLAGSDMMTSIFQNGAGYNSGPIQNNTQQIISQQNQSIGIEGIQSADSIKWDGPDLESNYVKYENIPHKVVAVRKQSTGEINFKAVRTDTGEELTDYPVPTIKANRLSINEENKVVKGPFDELYPLEEEN